MCTINGMTFRAPSCIFAESRSACVCVCAWASVDLRALWRRRVCSSRGQGKWSLLLPSLIKPLARDIYLNWYDVFTAALNLRHGRRTDAKQTLDSPIELSGHIKRVNGTQRFHMKYFWTENSWAARRTVHRNSFFPNSSTFHFDQDIIWGFKPSGK